jgi:hypothetical protein
MDHELRQQLADKDVNKLPKAAAVIRPYHEVARALRVSQSARSDWPARGCVEIASCARVRPTTLQQHTEQRYRRNLNG